MMRLTSRSRQGLALVAGLALSLPLLVGQGCPSIPTGGGGGAPDVSVIAPSLDQTLAVGERVTIIYDAVGDSSTAVSAFYDRDGQAGTGDEVTFLTGLPRGEDKYTQLITSSLAAGTYSIGITATNGAGTSTDYAGGRITLVAAPQIVFASPVGAVRVGAGVRVPIEFNAGVSTFSYRVFYDNDGQLDGDETTIAEGSKSDTSKVTAELDTSAVTPGVYYVGATIATPAGGTATSYAPATLTVVSGAFIQVLAPTVGLVASPGALVQVVVAASDPGSSGSTIRIFYDADNRFGNGNEFTITTIPVTGSGTTWDTKNVPPGSYFVGAELVNGMTPPLVSYSSGPVRLDAGGPGGGGGTGAGLLRVTTPQVPTTILQGRTFRINWITNVDPGKATVNVYLEPDINNDNTPDGPATRRLVGNAGIDATQQFVDLESVGLVGKFYVLAILTGVDGTVATDYAEGTLTIRPLHFWVGDLLTKKDTEGRVVAQSGPFQGAVFQGANFQDNLGSAMTVSDDFDGDGRGEVVLAAQFGKPFLYAQGGRGAGEAYLFYGSRSRLSGTLGVNATGSASLPGVIFSGIMPNPYAGNEPLPQAKAGNSVPYTVDGEIAGPFASEGLRSLTVIPDQDGDGVGELVFGFPWCNSYSLSNQAADGILPVPIRGIGRLENNGHFLRGGLVMVSSRNPLLNSRTAVSRHLDRVLELHEVGQAFNETAGSLIPEMRVPVPWPIAQNNCADYDVDQAGNDTWIFPCDGFFQDTTTLMDPPRLADPLPASPWIIHPDADVFGCDVPTNMVSLSQVDPPAGPTDLNTVGGLITTIDDICADRTPPPFGTIQVAGTGFYTTTTSSSCADRVMAEPLPPFGCRILGQTTTQLDLGTTANRFASSVSVSGDFLMIGAPLRTVLRRHVVNMPEAARAESGEIYMYQMKRRTAPPQLDGEFPYALPASVGGPTPSPTTPYPHNWVISDLGFTLYGDDCGQRTPLPNGAMFEMLNPFHIVGAAPGDRIGEVAGVGDVNADGVDDFLVGGAGTNAGRGAVYLIYRRQPEVEGNYLLEQLQLDPLNPNRLNGLMIIGEPGENLGTSLAASGPLNDDFNDDGFADVLIGSPRATGAAGFLAGQVFVMFGGKNLLNPAGGSTIAQLRDSGDGMLLTGAFAGDMAGTTVANVGDVNGDSVPDIAIAAPEGSPRFDANGDTIPETVGLDLNGDRLPDDLDGNGAPDDMTNAGLVYVVFGGQHLTGTIGLNLIGTKDLPGIVIVGRKGGDRMGGGFTQTSLLSRGLSPAGDLDNDSRGDLLISSILADPDGKTNAGEVYVVYGFTP